MNDKKDLKNVFGEADDGFKYNVFQTLEKLKKEEEIKSMRKISSKFSIAVIAMVICMLVTTTVVLAMTNTWSILDFLENRRSDVTVLPEATQIIQDDVNQTGGMSELATFSLRQAIFDGKNVYLTVEVKPNNSKNLLLGLDALLSDPVANMGPLFADKNITISEYASENQKIPLHTLITELITDSKDTIITSADFVLEENGTLVYMLSGYYNGTAAEFPMELSCNITPFINQDGKDVIDLANMQTTTLSFTLKQDGTTKEASSINPVEYADVGVRVDKVTLTGTPMTIYTQIEFTVIDQEKYAATDGGLWFEFLDNNGERLPGGASNGSIESLDGSEIHFIQQDSLQATDSLPSEINLRGYNCWDKNRYESHTIKMK